MAPETVICPRCGFNRYTPYDQQGVEYDPAAPPPALSRKDNETYVCSPCGHDEAMRNFAGDDLQDEVWPLNQGVYGIGTPGGGS